MFINFFLAVIELVRELLINNMHNKFEQDKWKTFHVIAPTTSNYWHKMRKIAINQPFWFFFWAIIELVRELVICNMHNKLGRRHEKLFKLSRPQGQIIDVNAKNLNKSAILNYFSAIIACVRTGH